MVDTPPAIEIDVMRLTRLLMLLSYRLVFSQDTSVGFVKTWNLIPWAMRPQAIVLTIESCHMITKHHALPGLEFIQLPIAVIAVIRSFNLFIDVRKEKLIHDIRDPHLIAPIRRQVDSFNDHISP